MPRGNTAAGRSLWEQARRGLEPILSNLNGFVNWLGDEVTPEVMLEAVEETMELSDHYAPKDTGTMVNSRYQEVKRRGGVTSIELGYNRYGEAPYTIFVHEMPQFYHDPPTQYKFLQRALDEQTPELIGRIAAGIKRKTGL